MRLLLVKSALSFGLVLPVWLPAPVAAQVPPTEIELSLYTGLHAAAAEGDIIGLAVSIAAGSNPNVRDGNGRTPLHVAAFRGRHRIAAGLIGGKADPNALDKQKYDAVTIAAVNNDVPMVRLLLERGASAKNVTSPYDGTALIAAAHLGHVEVVKALIEGGAPLDHVNNLGWTALIEAIVLGDGGANHTETVRALVSAGANLQLTDRDGRTPLTLAHSRGYRRIAELLEQAGARP